MGVHHRRKGILVHEKLEPQFRRPASESACRRTACSGRYASIEFQPLCSAWASSFFEVSFSSFPRV